MSEKVIDLTAFLPGDEPRPGDDLRERFRNQIVGELVPSFLKMGYRFEHDGERWVSHPPTDDYHPAA